MPLQDLLERLRHVRATELSTRAALFQELARDGQHPRALFVTCSDSRIDPNLLTGTEPGELFIVRTVGNIVQPPGVGGDPDPTLAALEFAVGVLGVPDVVVCGHTHCGAMAALYDPVPARFDQLTGWVEHARPAAVPEGQLDGLDAPERNRRTAERNVLLSLDRIAAVPLVAERRGRGDLELHGWMLDLASQAVAAFDPGTRTFEPLD